MSKPEMMLSDEDRKLLVKIYNLLGEIIETLEVLDDKGVNG